MSTRINPKQNVWNQMFCFLIYASNESKSVLARDLDDCRDNQN